MTLPQARLVVLDGRLGVACPYCGTSVPRDSVRFHPACDPGEGRIDARNVSWESRCPRCGGDFSISGGTACDPGEGRIDARNVSWESRCPRCGGDFSISGGTAPVRSGFGSDFHAHRDDMLLSGVMAQLDSLETAVAELRNNQSQPRFPKDPPWVGRDGA